MHRLVLPLYNYKLLSLVLVCGHPRSVLFFFHFNTALAIILEHSFYLWDKSPLSGTKHLITATNVYKASEKHVTVMDAVKMVFEEDKVEEAKGSKDLSFSQKLIQIALKNRLCMFHFASKSLMCLILSVLAPP